MNDIETLRGILDAQLEMVCRFTADGTILFANLAYARTMGYPREELTGLILWDFVPESEHEAIRAELAKLTPENPERTIENRLEAPDGTVRWTLWRNHALAFDNDGRWQVAQSTGIDITERKTLEDRLRLMVEELNHRVKNTLMVVQAMAWQSFCGTQAPVGSAEMYGAMENFNARLHALASAHTVLSREQWAGAALADVVRQGLTICDGEELGPGGGRRVAVTGPDLRISAVATVSLVMVLHELATNAIKYGALSNAEGTVAIVWAVQGDGGVVLQWREQGGPPVALPQRRGFGSRLIRDTITRQLSGEAHIDYAATGLVVRLVLPAHHFDLVAPPAILSDSRKDDA